MRNSCVIAHHQKVLGKFMLLTFANGYIRWTPDWDEAFQCAGENQARQLIRFLERAREGFPDTVVMRVDDV